MIKKEDIGFYNLFYEAVETIKDNIQGILPIWFIISLGTFTSAVYGTTQKDYVLVLTTLGTVVITTIVSIFYVNYYFSKITDSEFSIKKCFWDIPTYIFYELGFSLVFIFGLIALVIPGLIVGYLFMFVPLVAILLDHDEEGIFKKTRKIISHDYLTYTLILIVTGLLIVINLATEKIMAFTQNYTIVFLWSFIIALFSLLSLSLSVSFFTSIEFYRKENKDTDVSDSPELESP